jgi:deazaflavin-dependent oxidoreductase (nitroreductase family)
MHIPYFMRRVNRVVTNPVVGTVAWLVPPLAIVHHEGRRSGRHYRTPVVAFRTADGFVIPMTYGWDVDWARNLRAAKRGEVVQLGRRFRVRNRASSTGSGRSPGFLCWCGRCSSRPGFRATS